MPVRLHERHLGWLILRSPLGRHVLTPGNKDILLPSQMQEVGESEGGRGRIVTRRSL